MRYLSKRTMLGALLFLVFVGEFTVGLYSGLLTNLGGLLAIVGLYVVLFLLYEALIQRYTLTNGRLLLLTFAIYSVIVTGLLHGEIANFAKPGEIAITSLIRLQCSLFAPFAYYLLNRRSKRDPARVLSVGKALLLAGVYVLVLSPSHTFGLAVAADTFRAAPVLSVLFSIAAIVSIVLALRPRRPGALYRSQSMTMWTWLLFLVALVPLMASFVGLLVLMPVATFIFARQARWRNSPV